MKCPKCGSETSLKKEALQKSGLDYESHYCTKCREGFVDMKQLDELAKKEKTLRDAKKTKISRWGNSLAVRIPKEFATELKITPGKHVLVSRENKALKIILQS